MSSPSRPLVITGMHRSGTSLVASYLSSLGISMGDRLIPADRRNPRGYFEDAGFVELHGRILRDATVEEPGHRDWGWTESERLDRGVLARYAGEARALATSRSGGGEVWGWKDPRTTLLLDFWDEVLEERPLYVLLYRLPWEVADSMQRLGADVFLGHPEWAYPIWTFYNRHLLDFHRRHADRSLLVSVNALLRDPARLAPLLRERLGLAMAGESLDAVRDRDLFVSLEPRDPLVSLVAATSPRCVEVLAGLDAAADLPATELWSASPLQGERWRPEGPVDLSVVIPCYELGELLVEALASAERSAPERCELIVVDDGSRQPRTREVLQILADGGYRIVSQPNAGLSAARNRGIREARGRYVLPLDADNRLVPAGVAASLRLLDADPQVAVAYGDRINFGLRSGHITHEEFDPALLLWTNTIDACAVYRREVWESCGGYDPAMTSWEDWEFWIAVLARGWKFRHVPEVTFEYRVRPGSMLALAEGEERWRRLYGHVYRKHRDFYAEHFGGALLAAKEQIASISAYANGLLEARDRLQREAGLLAADAQALRESRDRLQRDIDLLASTVEPEREALRASLRELQQELDTCRREMGLMEREMAFMEGTRAWRLRGALVRLKHRLRGPG
ncbi:MAG: glycosyltransferase [Thermoanaerobaculia bacterium]